MQKIMKKITQNSKSNKNFIKKTIKNDEKS